MDRIVLNLLFTQIMDKPVVSTVYLFLFKVFSHHRSGITSLPWSQSVMSSSLFHLNLTPYLYS